MSLRGWCCFIVFVTKLFYLDWTISVKHSVTVLPICCQLVYVLGRRVLWEAEFEFS